MLVFIKYVLCMEKNKIDVSAAKDWVGTTWKTILKTYPAENIYNTEF